MAGEKRIPHGEYESLNQPERIDKALQSCIHISEQVEPLGISNKQEIKSALIALNFMLSDAYDEVLERNGSPPDELAEESYQEALRTLERYIQRHKKEPEPDVDTDLTGRTDFSN